jgi:hypothetical protein
MAVELPPIDLLTRDPWRSLIFEFVRRLNGVFFAGQRITSWHRTPERNAAAGGDRQSQHLFSLGIDVVGPNLNATQIFARRNGLIAVNEGDHLHIQLFPKGVLVRAGVDFPTTGTDLPSGVAGRGGE